MTYTIFNEDAVKWANEYDGMPFHALLCDPPYHLTSIVKRFGKNGSAPAQYGTDGVFSRSSKGFMGQTWDGGDIAFRPETWAAFSRILYPGAFGMAFSASRNWHRLAVAIEDAGFVIHPSIFAWLQGQGFPKATNISKQMKERIGDVDFADVWKGHRYGLQALKPAVEPIIVFQKPYEGKPLDNIVNTGAGALNIDGSRIPTQKGVTINRFTDGAKPWGDGAGHEYKTEVTTQGRWTANFILDEETAPLLDAQAGNVGGGFGKRGASTHIYGGGKGFTSATMEEVGYGDNGGASRFFYTVSNQIDESDPVYYTAKVSPKERNAGLEEKNGHPTCKPIALVKYLATILLPPAEYSPRRIMVPFSGVASEMIGCLLARWEEVVGIEFDTENNYVEIAKKRLEHWVK